MLDSREGKAIAAVDTTGVLPLGRALALMGRYANTRTAVDLEEYEGHLYFTPVRGGSRGELREAGSGKREANAGSGSGQREAASELIVDDRLAYGERIRVLGDGRILVGADTLRRQPTPGSEVVPLSLAKPASAPPEHVSLIGEYGWEVVGIEDGYDGLLGYEGARVRPLTMADVRGILPAPRAKE